MRLLISFAFLIPAVLYAQGGCISGDCLSGLGEYHYDNGDKYKGYFHQGMKQGEGRYQFANGDVYVGDWTQDEMTGYGIWYDRTGPKTYAGYWLHGKQLPVDFKITEGCAGGNCHMGWGVKIYPDGSVYAGEFISGERSGWGLLRFPNEDVYRGEFSLDTLWGFGALTYANGDRYQGEWKGKSLSGPGAYWLRNGITYRGEIEEGKPQGRGLKVDRDGKLQTGFWMADSFIGDSLPLGLRKPATDVCQRFLTLLETRKTHHKSLYAEPHLEHDRNVLVFSVFGASVDYALVWEGRTYYQAVMHTTQPKAATEDIVNQLIACLNRDNWTIEHMPSKNVWRIAHKNGMLEATFEQPSDGTVVMTLN